MDPYPDPLQSTFDFLCKSFLGLAIAALIFITPFAIYNWIAGRYLIGTVCCLILALFTLNIGSIVWHKRYRLGLTQFGLVPAILLLLGILLGNQEMIGIFWCYPAAGSFHFMLPKGKAWTATACLFALLLPLGSQFVAPLLAIRIVATLALVSITTAIFVWVICKQQNQLRVMAITDPLTGLLNRMLLHETLDWAIEQAQRMGMPMTLIALDIDYFKRVNDTYGHGVGDDVLRAVSQVMMTRVRRVDKVFRLGGEEFLVLLHGTGEENAQWVAEELRRRIAELEVLPGLAVTVSVGLATLQPEEDWIGWIQRSDKMLYQAKTGGRNRVEN